MDEHREQHPAQDRGPDPVADEALARLRAADPAADARLDADALRARVAARTDAAGTPSGTLSGTVDGDPAGVAALAPRRRSRWLQVAAVGVGAALVAGAGGFALGTAGDDGTDAAAPITLESGAGAAPMSAAGAAADTRIAPGFGLRTQFTAAGLPDDAGSARAWALDAASVFSAGTAARVAAALGVAGDPVQQYGAWTVGPQDGSGPAVTLQPDGTASVSYYDPARDPWSCTASAPDTPDAGAGAAEGGAATPEPGLAPVDPSLVEPALPATPAPACDPALGDAPTGDAAVARVRELLTSLGVDADGFEYRVADPGDDARVTTVDALAVVDGQQTGLSWNVTLVGDGVQSLYGSLAPLVDLGEYPVVGAATAVGRLDDPRFGSFFGGVMPLARAADTARTLTAPAEVATAPADEAATPTVPPTARPGDPLSWPVQQVTITEARLGLGLLTRHDGAALLVPAYELADGDGGTWSVIAVDEGSLDLAG